MNTQAKQVTNGNLARNQQRDNKVKDSKDAKKKVQKNNEQEEEGDQDYGNEDNDDQWFSDSSTSSNEADEPREPRLIMYAAFTQYDVVKEVGKSVFNYHLTKNDQKDWDIAWFDGAISIKLLQKMWPHQRTNHFPGMYNLARKNCLGRHLMRMQKWFPDDYNFFPQTFMLPTDYKEFKNQITAKRNKTFIVKPEASCQGKGIFLTRNFEDLDPNEHYVVQRYMHKPYLIDGFKFDLRIYVLLAGVNPLRIFVYREGLARFATVPYESPAPNNLANLFMHLTNYAINKDSENFISNTDENADDVGSKRSFSSILRHITEEFGDNKAEEVFDEIKHLIIKTLCIAQPYLQHLYKSCQPDDVENALCCQVLGFDVILDHNLKPQLLEVNQSPSFTTDSPLDYKIKKALITDSIKMWNLSIKRKLRTKGNKRAEMQRRLLNYQQNTGQGNNTKDTKDNAQTTMSQNRDKKNQGQTTEEKGKDEKQEEIKGDAIQLERSQSKLEQTQQQPAKPPRIVKGVKSPITEDKKALLKLQLQQEREQQRKKKFIQRERYERDNCGDYDLVYPLVTYEDEFEIIDKYAETAKVYEADGEENKNTVFVSKEWSKQQRYLAFMEKAKQLWESFTQGNTASKRKKEQEQKEKEEKEEQLRKEQLKKKAILLAKQRKEKEEKAKQEEYQRRQQYEIYMQQQHMRIMNYEYSARVGSPDQMLSADDRFNFEKRFMNANQNHHHIPYRTQSTDQNLISSRNGLQIIQESQLKNNPQDFLQNKVTIQDQQSNMIHQNRNTKSGITNQQLDLEIINSLGPSNLAIIGAGGNNVQNGFYLPQVDKKQGINNSNYAKKAIHEEYDKQQIKYNHLIRYYNMGSLTEDTILPAVPALGNAPSNEKKKPQSNQRREIVLVENPQALQGKPPLNSQLHKREDSQMNQGIMNVKKASNPQNNPSGIILNQRLNEILQLSSNPNFNTGSVSNINQPNYSKFQLQPQQAISLGNPTTGKLLTDGKLNGVQNYQMKPNNYELIRSVSLDKRDLPNITHHSQSTKISQSVAQSQITNRNTESSKNSTQNTTQSQKDQKKMSPKKTRSEVFNSNDIGLQLGIVGERKILLTNDQSTKNEKQKTGMKPAIKLKEKAWLMGGATQGISNINSNNYQGMNIVNPQELYKLLN